MNMKKLLYLFILALPLASVRIAQSAYAGEHPWHNNLNRQLKEAALSENPDRAAIQDLLTQGARIDHQIRGVAEGLELSTFESLLDEEKYEMLLFLLERVVDLNTELVFFQLLPLNEITDYEGLKSIFSNEPLLEEIIDILIKRGFDVNALNYREDKRGMLPIQAAVKRIGLLPLVKILMKKGADPKLENSGVNALFAAFMTEDFEKVKFFMEQKEIANDLLSTAMQGVYSDFNRFQLRYDDDYYAYNFDGFTILHFATMYLNTEAIDFLLENGMNPMVRDALGLTPLHHLGRMYHKTDKADKASEIVRLFKKYGANINDYENSKSFTPLALAIEREDSSTVKALLTEGANPDIRNREGASFLHRAAERMNPSLEQVLITEGADVRARDFHGNTPLHSLSGSHEPNASLERRAEATRILLRELAERRRAASDAAKRRRVAD